MIKRLLFIGGGIALVAVLVFGRSAVSYVRTSAGYVSQSVRNSVPIEFEIERARGMLKDLVPEVRKNMHVIAKEEVEVKRLQEQIARAENRLGKEKGHLIRLKTDLNTGQNVFRYAGRDYTVNQVKVDLANRFERYKTGEATLASYRQILEARQASLEAARQKLEGMLASKRQLQVEVENLEARLQMIAAAKATSRYEFDDSRLGRVKQLVSDLRTRLDVADNLLKAETQFHDEIPLDKAAPENIVDQVTEYFSDERPVVAAVDAEPGPS
jgi:peptidoglycan hydrolase CwlO-like protein